MKSLQARMFAWCSAGIMVVVLSSSLSLAQGMRMSPEERAAILKDSLGLDSSQTIKVTAIFKAAQSAMTEIFQANQGDREAMRSAMTEQAKKTDAKIDSVLTDAQKKKYDEMKKNRQMRRMRRSDNQ